MIPKRIILHHSLTKDGKTVSLDAMRKWQMGLIGQPDPNKPNYNYYCQHPDKDIAYHFVIEQINERQEIFVGRMMNEIGAHTKGQNHDTLGICFVGNYDIDEVPPEQWNMGIKFVTSLCVILKISPSMIYGHHEFNPNKTCPGTKFPVHGFIQQVAERLGTQ